MISRYFIIVLLLCSLAYQAQDLKKYNPLKAEPVGGSECLEQILQTQLTLPKNTLSLNGHQPLDVYFTIDSVGQAANILVRGENTTPVLRKEITRIFKFLRFHRTDPDPMMPYHLPLLITSDKYSHYYKQKSRYNLKGGLQADSSYQVYTRADRSPEYYKNGDEGLTEFLLEELEYPRVAIDKSLEGTVVIEFIVETNGFVTGVTPKQVVSGGCTEEAIRLIKKTRWKAAELNNKLVRYKTSYPITFSLRNVNRTVGYSGQ